MNFLGRIVARLGAADDGEAPLIGAVDRHDGRPCALRPEDDEAIGPALVVQRHQPGTAEDHIGGVGEGCGADHRNAERLAHQAASAVASHEIVRPHGLARAGSQVLDLGRDAVAVLHEGHQARPVAHLDARLRGREVAQDRIEHVLRTALAPLRAHRRRRAPRRASGNARARARSQRGSSHRRCPAAGRADRARPPPPRPGPSAGRIPWCGYRPGPCAADRSTRPTARSADRGRRASRDRPPAPVRPGRRRRRGRGLGVPATCWAYPLLRAKRSNPPPGIPGRPRLLRRASHASQ